MTSTEKVRRFRDRQRRGAVVLPPLEVSETVVDFLRRHGFLSPLVEDDNKPAIAEAVQRLLEGAAETDSQHT